MDDLQKALKYMYHVRSRLSDIITRHNINAALAYFLHPVCPKFAHMERAGSEAFPSTGMLATHELCGIEVIAE